MSLLSISNEYSAHLRLIRRRTWLAVALCLALRILLGAITPDYANAHGHQAGQIAIAHPWARETAPGQVNGGGFMLITNNGARADRLLSASSSAAREVQIHTMSMDGGIMRMRQLTDGIAIPAHSSVELRPGSLHVMFIGLRAPLRQGQRIAVTLRFQHAGRVTVRFVVQPVGAMGVTEAGHAGL